MKTNESIAEKTFENPEDMLIDINTANVETLILLQGIGEKKAMDIVEYRSLYGDFKSIDEIKNVSGIGDKIFENIKDYIMVQ